MANDLNDILPEDYLKRPPLSIDGNLTQFIFDLSRTRNDILFKIQDPESGEIRLKTLTEVFAENNIPEEISDPNNPDLQKKICEILKNLLFKDNPNFDAQKTFEEIAKFFHQGNLFLMPQGLCNQQLNSFECAFVKPNSPEQKQEMFQQKVILSSDQTSPNPIVRVQQIFRCSAPIANQFDPEEVNINNAALTVRTNHQIDLTKTGDSIKASPKLLEHFIHSEDPNLSALFNRTKENSAQVKEEFKYYLASSDPSHSPPKLR